jgi:choline dehydrogenase-like flavoprotein
MNTASKFQLFSIITKCKCLFLDSNAKKKNVAFVEKELQQAKMDNAVLARYISARRNKE